MRILLLGALVFLASACAHRSVLPEAKEVQISRESPGKDCTEIGPLTGNTLSAKGTREEALANLRQEAANKGANYVVVKQYSAYGTSVVGMAYECH